MNVAPSLGTTTAPGEFLAPFVPSPEALVDRMLDVAGVGPGDISVAMLYDVFSPLVLWQLEAYGFCGLGEAGPFVEEGNIDWEGGELPVNTHGGSLSEAYVHGFNHILEAVRQLRGTSTCQVAGAEVALVAGAPVVPTSALILHR